RLRGPGGGPPRIVAGDPTSLSVWFVAAPGHRLVRGNTARGGAGEIVGCGAVGPGHAGDRHLGPGLSRCGAAAGRPGSRRLRGRGDPRSDGPQRAGRRLAARPRRRAGAGSRGGSTVTETVAAEFGPRRLRDLPPEERPRERLARHGAGALSNRELLALLVG